jgi:hypothetical protein
MGMPVVSRRRRASASSPPSGFQLVCEEKRLGFLGSVPQGWVGRPTESAGAERKSVLCHDTLGAFGGMLWHCGR